MPYVLFPLLYTFLVGLLVVCRFVCSCLHCQSFISGTHHYEVVAPNVDIILQSGRFWAMSIASFREWLNDSRSCWVIFIHVVRGHPGGLLQFSKGEAVKICLASDLSGIHAMWPNREKRHAWTVAERCGCSVFRFTSSFHTRWYHLIPNSLNRHYWSRALITYIPMQTKNQKKTYIDNSSSFIDNLQHYNNYFSHHCDINIVCCQPVCHC